MQIKLPSFMTKIKLWSASASKQNKRAKFLMLIKAVQSFEEERVVVSQGKKFFFSSFAYQYFSISFQMCLVVLTRDGCSMT